jgi:outer membrane protein assembly factor BamB
MQINRRGATRSLLATLAGAGLMGADWTRFLGPDGRSVGAAQALPTSWSAAKDGMKNIAWKSPLVGRGVSGPITVGDRVFVTASSGARQERLTTLAFSIENGAPLWRRDVWATGRTFCHPTSAVAANTPASDGRRVFSLYSSNDITAYSLDGRLEWYRALALDNPGAGNDVGMAASPIVEDGVVVCVVENTANSFACALDAETGATLWQVERPSGMNWCTPVVIPGEAAGEKLVLLLDGEALTAVSLKSGQVKWTHDIGGASIPSLVAVDGLILVPSQGLCCLRTGGGAIEQVWKEAAIAPGNATPIVLDGRVYTVGRAGVLFCADLLSGKQFWKTRIAGSYWATPVIAGGHLYAPTQTGKTYVVRLSPEAGEIVGEGDFGEEAVLGSPAVVDDALLVRTDQHLWKVQLPKKA